MNLAEAASNPNDEDSQEKAEDARRYADPEGIEFLKWKLTITAASITVGKTGVDLITARRYADLASQIAHVFGF